MARYIRYQEKQGKTYAQLMDSLRVDGEKKNIYIESLGIVLDKERGVFKSKQRGLYSFTLDDGYADAPADIETIHVQAKRETLILDFGDCFMLDRYLRDNTPFYDLYSDILPNQRDTLLTLILFRLLTDDKPYMYAQSWYEGSFARILYPKATLQSQGIRDFLIALGSEGVVSDFFSFYLNLLYEGKGGTGILIDDAMNPEMRRVFVIDRITGMPLFLGCCQGNVMDVNTLFTTVKELEQLGVNVDMVLSDALYCSKDNVAAFYANKKPFVSRVGTDRKLYKELVEMHVDSLRQAKYKIGFDTRVVHMRRFPVDLHGHAGYAYLGLDLDSHDMQEKKISLEALNDTLPFRDTDDEMKKLGTFVLVSSDKMECKDLLSLYNRHKEQLFDMTKNSADIHSFPIQGEKALKGHLMLSFLSTVLLHLLQQDMLLQQGEENTINPEGIFHMLRNQKCKVYDGLVIPQEPTRMMLAIYKLLKMESPVLLPYQSS
jgi:hypothetical protein